MIQVKHLTRLFGPKRAVDDVSFTVERGEVLGFLGPNGAGKSTTMRMITGFIPPTEGQISIGGHSIVTEPIQAKTLVGYLPENAPAYTDMTVHGFLNFMAELRGFSGEAKKKAVHRAVETCFLEGVLHQSVDTLSKGYRHRTCFAQSIIHDPPVLILDEPTDGLDPNQKHEVRSLIKRMGREKAIIFSTHILEEVDAACTRAIIIDRGRIVANGTPEELRNRSESAGAVLLRLRGVSLQTLTTRLYAAPAVKKVNVIEDNHGSLTVRIFPKQEGKPADLPRLIGETAQAYQWTVERLELEQGRLDEVFRTITISDTAKEVAK